MADAVDLKSNVFGVRVRIPSPGPFIFSRKEIDMKAYRCDRCGEFYDKDAYSKTDRTIRLPYVDNSEVKIIGISAKYLYDCTGTLIDICPRCIGELKNWLEGSDFPSDEDFK